MKTKNKKKKFAAFLHPKYLVVGVLAVSLLATSLAFATSSGPLPVVKDPTLKVNENSVPEEKKLSPDQMHAFVVATVLIDSKIRAFSKNYQTYKLKDLRLRAAPILSALTAFCRDGHLDCAIELKNVEIGIKGATKDALNRILKENWSVIKKKARSAQK